MRAIAFLHNYAHTGVKDITAWKVDLSSNEGLAHCRLGKALFGQVNIFKVQTNKSLAILSDS